MEAPGWEMVATDEQRQWGHNEWWASYDAFTCEAARKAEKRTMGLKVSDKGGDYTPAPEGTHLAVCTGMFDIGTQTSPLYGTTKYEVILRWELCEERTQDDRPLIISAFYTASLSPKANLRRDLDAWRGKKFTAEELKEFDLKSILGAPCMLSVTHNENGKAKVSGVMSIPKGMTKPKAEGDLIAYDMDEMGWRERVEDLPSWIQDKVRMSEEWTGIEGGVQPVAEVAADLSDDIPF